MPTYQYKCSEHGYFEQQNSMKDHAKGNCPTCGSDSKQVILTAPAPMIEMMADAGFPGAFETSGNRLEKKHRAAGQYHNTPSRVWAEEDPDPVSVTPATD